MLVGTTAPSSQRLTANGEAIGPDALFALVDELLAPVPTATPLLVEDG
jgi:hypothetical protein